MGAVVFINNCSPSVSSFTPVSSSKNGGNQGVWDKHACLSNLDTEQSLSRNSPGCECSRVTACLGTNWLWWFCMRGTRSGPDIFICTPSITAQDVALSDQSLFSFFSHLPFLAVVKNTATLSPAGFSIVLRIWPAYKHTSALQIRTLERSRPVEFIQTIQSSRRGYTEQTNSSQPSSMQFRYS